MDTLLKFGVGSTAYSFPQHQQQSVDYNFADTLQQSVRVIGKDGAINPFGTGRAPAEMGDMSVTFMIEGETSEDVAGQVDVIRGLAYRGLERLYMKHRNGRVMWTWAMASNVRSSQNVQAMPQLRQVMQLNFQCPDAKWYYTEGQLFFNDGLVADDGLTLPVVKLPETLVGNGDTVTVHNFGQSPVAPRIVWEVPTGVTATDPTLTWANADGNVVYSLQYVADLVAGDVINIDCTDQSCTPSYSNLVITHGAWMEISPGAQILTITGTFSADINLTIHFDEGWV